MKPYDTFFDNMLVMIAETIRSEDRRLPVYTGGIQPGFSRTSEHVRQDRYLTGADGIVS